MNKVLTLVLLFLIAITSKAQDTIIFDDARVHPVKITKVGTKGVVYERRGGKKKALFVDVMQFKKGDQWFYYNEETEKLEEQSEPFFDFAINPLQVPKNFRYSPFSIGATFTFDLSSRTSYGWPQRYSPADNWRIRIEPEMHFTDWFSLKVPLVIPLTLDDQSKDGHIVTHNSGPQEYGIGGIEFYYDFGYNYYYEPTNPSDYPKKTGYYGSSNESEAGTREILGQVGLTPKFYPFLQQKVAFYIAPSINFGIGNYNQINYYATFDYQDSIAQGNPSNPYYIDTWELVSERLEVKKANFSYFRGELTIGFNFNITKALNFSIESGFTTELIALTPIENSNLTVIRQNDGFEFESQSFEPTVLDYRESGIGGGFAMNRIMLVYRFGGRKVEAL
jgi:hypothetical protein